MIKCIGCLIYDRSKDMCLLQERGTDVAHPLKLGLWGGKMEKGEDFATALHRELTEEMGVMPEYEKIYPLDTYLSDDNNFIYYSFLLIVDGFDDRIIIDKKETFDFVWMPYHLIHRLRLHPGFKKTIDQKNDYILSIIDKHKK